MSRGVFHMKIPLESHDAQFHVFLLLTSSLIHCINLKSYEARFPFVPDIPDIPLFNAKQAVSPRGAFWIVLKQLVTLI